MKTYIFQVTIAQDDDGRWGAEIPLLPGCNAWGYTKDETLEALRETALAFMEIMIEDGDPIPDAALAASDTRSRIDSALLDTVAVTL